MKNRLTSTQSKLKRYIEKEGLLQKGDRLLLAVSGGADSLSLLYIMAALQQKLGIGIYAAHFDHLTRNGKSTEEAYLVQRHCRNLHIPFFSGQAEKDAFLKGNFENEARNARYAFLQETAAAQNCCKIATAHHKNDSAETLLLHLIRGCGMEGLTGIEPANGNIIRPLLCLTRQEIEEYCRLADIEFAQDMSNFDASYSRNRLRLLIMPQLEQMNPKLTQMLCNNAEILRAENAYMDEQAKIYLQEQKEENIIEQNSLLNLPLALQRRVIRKFVNEHTGHIMTFSQTEAALDMQEGSHVRLAGKLLLFCQDGRIKICENLPEMNVKDNFVNNEFKTGIYDLGNAFFCKAELLPYQKESGKDILWLSADDILFLSWHCRRQGDKMKVKGMQGHKTVKAIMNEASFPLAQRTALPLLWRKGEIIWVPFLSKATAEYVYTKP